jgi:purine-binding chemotaxis protein CheW
MTSHYIIFSVAGTSYALPSQQVGHIEMVDEVTRVPNAPHFVDGVVFSRGEVVPALNLRARFGFDRVANDIRTRLLVVQAGGRAVGLIVDAAREFLTIPDAAIKPPNEALSGLSGTYLRGIATLGDRMVVVVDLDGLLDPDHFALAASSGLALPQAQEIP